MIFFLIFLLEKLIDKQTYSVGRNKDNKYYITANIITL